MYARWYVHFIEFDKCRFYTWIKLKRLNTFRFPRLFVAIGTMLYVVKVKVDKIKQQRGRQMHCVKPDKRTLKVYCLSKWLNVCLSATFFFLFCLFRIERNTKNWGEKNYTKYVLITSPIPIKLNSEQAKAVMKRRQFLRIFKYLTW